MKPQQQFTIISALKLVSIFPLYYLFRQHAIIVSFVLFRLLFSHSSLRMVRSPILVFHLRSKKFPPPCHAIPCHKMHRYMYFIYILCVGKKIEMKNEFLIKMGLNTNGWRLHLLLCTVISSSVRYFFGDAYRIPISSCSSSSSSSSNCILYFSFSFRALQFFFVSLAIFTIELCKFEC